MNKTSLVILGATGDLTKRLLMPALYRLYQRGLLKDVSIVGYAMETWDEARFKKHILDALETFSDEYEAKSAKAFGELLGYQSGKLEAVDLVVLKDHLGAQTLFYLALPPALFGPAACALGEAGFNQPDNAKGWRRLVVEKPFGVDLASAKQLREDMHAHWQEEQILRIDHFLGKETTQNLMLFRFANRFLEPLWNSNHIKQVQITYAETLGVEKRAAYYDKAGALRDMLQNHLMQLFSLTAMEPLTSYDAELLRNHKVEVLRAVKPISQDNVDKYAARGQYGSGQLSGKHVPAYMDEEGIDKDSCTETFAALRLEIDNWRWQGVPFYLRSGKRLVSNTSEIAVEFKPTPLAHVSNNNWMIFHIKPNQNMTLLANAKLPGLEMKGHQVALTTAYSRDKDKEFSAYEQLLTDAMEGDRTHFLRFDEVECAWQLLEPVLEAWQKGKPETYQAGSEGPDSQKRLLDKADQWRKIHADNEEAV